MGVVALDMACLNWSNRRETFTQEQAIVTFNPQKAVVADHCTRGVKGSVSRAQDSKARRNPEGVDRSMPLIVVVGDRWGGRGMLDENSIH